MSKINARNDTVVMGDDGEMQMRGEIDAVGGDAARWGDQGEKMSGHNRRNTERKTVHSVKKTRRISRKRPSGR